MDAASKQASLPAACQHLMDCRAQRLQALGRVMAVNDIELLLGKVELRFGKGAELHHPRLQSLDCRGKFAGERS